ncbi:MAG: AraC family transcriptional regulator [Clostridiales bacterium]|jgi:hypothetical protein|nr:AraC family transcriptional regulator [Clostridiales bacterium]
MKITVKDLQEKLVLKALTETPYAQTEVNDMYIGDLLSWVMSRAKEGNVWVTIQGHINIVAVAVLTGVSCIIAAEGAPVDADTISKANSEGIVIFTSKLTSFQLARRFAEISAE